MTAQTALLFEEARPRLFGLAYRMIGTYAEAEDVVQDTFARWLAADRDTITNAHGWLTTVCTRRAIDVLRSARRTRTQYVGAWLPEPLHPTLVDSDDALAGSLETALLLALERLAPRERAAFLLAEVFGVPHEQIAATLGIGEVACRKLTSRARAKVRDSNRPERAPLGSHRAILDEFEKALKTGDTSNLSGLLTDDVTLTADGGGRVPAAVEPIIGRDAVMAFIARAAVWWHSYSRSLDRIAHGEAMIVRDDTGVAAVLWFGPFDRDGRADALYVMRNPGKLGTITAPTPASSVRDR